VNVGILTGLTKDLNHPASGANWEVKDRIFLCL